MAHSIDGENPHTKAIAEFVSAFRFEKIPSEHPPPRILSDLVISRFALQKRQYKVSAG